MTVFLKTISPMCIISFRRSRWASRMALSSERTRPSAGTRARASFRKRARSAGQVSFNRKFRTLNLTRLAKTTKVESLHLGRSKKSRRFPETIRQNRCIFFELKSTSIRSLLLQ